MKIRRREMLLLAAVLFIALMVFLQTREGFEGIPAYMKGATYRTGDKVEYGGKVFVKFGRPFAQPVPETSDSPSSPPWFAISWPPQPFDTTKVYNRGDTVTYEGKTYFTQRGTNYPQEFARMFVSYNPDAVIPLRYRNGERVIYNNKVYTYLGGDYDKNVASPDDKRYWKEDESLGTISIREVDQDGLFDSSKFTAGEFLRLGKDPEVYRVITSPSPPPTAPPGIWAELPTPPPTPVANPAGQAAPPPVDMKPIPSNAMPLNPLAPTPPGVAGTVTPMQGSPAPVEATPGTVAPTVVLPVAAGPGTYMLRQVF